jgi:ElaB/YqjD/DUF883 family membrane-anchored ribosome-binding protein
MSRPDDRASDPDALRTEIEQTRAELAQTVDALSDRLNVKARLGVKATTMRQQVAGAMSQARQAAPQPAQDSIDRMSNAAAPVLRDVSRRAVAYRGQLICAAIGVLVLVVVLRRRRMDEA